MDYCQNLNNKLINGVWTFINCGVLQGPQIVQGWISYNPRNVIPYKTVYSRTDYISRKLKNLQLSPNEIRSIYESLVHSEK